MGTRFSARQTTAVGRITIAAAIAGLTGIAVTLAVVSSMLIGAAFGAENRGPLPGYEDYGQRHRSVAAADRAAGALDDYGIRCLESRWCSVPLGVPQPVR